MATSLRIHALFDRLALSKRALKVPTYGPGVRKNTYGILLIALGITFGLKAHRASKNAADAEWHQTHFVPVHVLKSTLLVYQLEKTTDLLQFQKISRTLPAQLDSKASIWVTEDGQAVALYQPKGAEGEILIYAKVKIDHWGNWKRLGVGLVGFEELLDFLEKVKNTAKTTLKIHKIAQDPRQIVY
jgi:hypothetical protein